MAFVRKIYTYLETLSNTSMDANEVTRMERRLQMLIALILFTPTVLASLGSDTFQQDKNVLTWGAIVSIYILIYIFIEASRGKVNKLKGYIVNYGVWVNLFAFVPYFLLMALYQDVISGLPLVAFFAVIMVVFWSPLALILALGFEFALGEFFSFVKTVRSEPEHMNYELKDRLRFWKEKADHVTNDHWVRFMLYWMMFDAAITEMSGKDGDGARLDWFFETDNELKDIFMDYWAQQDFLNVIDELRKLSPIRDMRPSKRDIRTVELNDINDIEQIIRFIYQIRCNTFHGAKDLMDRRDQQLVRLSEMLFNRPLGRFVGLN